MIKIIITTIILFIIFIIILLSFNVKIEYFNNVIITKTYTILKDNDNNVINPDAWYKFDNSQNLGEDSSINNFNLTNNNIQYDSSLFIKGTGSAKSTGASLLSTRTGPNLSLKSWSVSCWLRPINNTTLQGNISYGQTYNYSRFLNLFYSNKRYVIDYNAVAYGTAIDTDDVGVWVHIVYIHVENSNDGLKRRMIYRNGVKIMDNAGGGGCIENSTRFALFGLAATQTSPSFTNNGGNLDDVRIYLNRVLTDDQIFELYNGYKQISEVIDTSTNCMANINSSGIIKRIPDTDFNITNISAINKINDYIFNQSFNNAGINYTLTFSRYLDNDYIPTNLLSRSNKLTVFYDSINRDNYDENGNYIGIFSKNTNIIPNLNNYPQKGDFIHIRLTSSSSNVPIKLKRYGFTADAQRPSRAPGTWALYAGTRLLEPSTKNPTLLVNNTTRLNNNSYCSANQNTYIHDISANETNVNELLFIFTSLADFGRNNNSDGVLSFMNLLLYTS